MALLQRIAALLILAYWISFWADHSDLPANIAYVEWSFLLPDLLWIAAAFWLAARWLISRDPRAPIVCAVAGGSMVYLGFLDVMMNLRNGQYTASLSRATLNALVNLACLTFGLVNIAFALRLLKPRTAER